MVNGKNGWEPSALTCARCGKEISIDVYMYNVATFKILGIDTLLHFCTSCFRIVQKEGKNALYKKS